MRKTTLLSFMVLFTISCSHVFSQLQPAAAIPANDFLNSIGVNTAINSRGEKLPITIESCKYLGVRWIRAGVPDKDEALNYWVGNNIDTYKKLRDELGVRFSIILPSEGDPFTSEGIRYEAGIPRLINGAKELIDALSPDAIIAFEGCNEPNNWGITYQGETGGGRNGTQHNWAVLARYHKDFYAAVKADPVLGVNGYNYPVWSFTDTGACPSQWNVGVQYLTVPMYEAKVQQEFLGATFADIACIHNYFIHPSWGPHNNNQTWVAADPSTKISFNSLYGNFGLTWAGKHAGYADEELINLPRVTTETGTTITQPTLWSWDEWKWTDTPDPDYQDPTKRVTEEDQALLYLTCYLSQFKRGFKYTSMYILRDRSDEGGNQTFGFYSVGDWVGTEEAAYSSHPRLSAHYLHNMTTILADNHSIESPVSISYGIDPRPETLHDLLLQKNDGTIMLVVWGEKFEYGAQPEQVTIEFDKAYQTINIYNPAQYDEGDTEKGTRPILTLHNQSSVTLEMLNHPYIIELITDEQENRHMVTVENGIADQIQTEAGNEITITAHVHPEGNNFLKWESDDDISFTDVDNATTTFIMPAKNVTVRATYEPNTHTITVMDGRADLDEAQVGTIVTITANEAPDGKEFVRWVSNNAVLSDAANLTTTFIMPPKDVVVTATYRNASSLKKIEEDVSLVAQKGRCIIHSDQKKVEYSIYNLYGQTIRKGIATGKYEIPLQAGIYIVKVNNITTKLVIE
ncbi:MAG: T9SS type A sorting domain-containing protein [Candidatus Azobacteroides sp.]|nr:T9SS type A sorting domain-containing protein [Candidatus Azobacteroides sp.]